MRTPTSFGVGEVLFSSEFRIAPQEVTAWELAQVLGGRDDRPSFRPRLEQPPLAQGPVPEGLILARALEALERSSSLAGFAVTPTSSGKLRSLAPVGVGERLSAVATVRYRSVRADESSAHLTLAVEIRGANRKLAEVEVGVEVSPKPGVASAPLLAA
ncbi:MAG: hypothetical protein R6X02_02850 [Enhygromyxa sp.]